MYVTRPLSLFMNGPGGAALPPPPEGPHSGCLIQQDDDEQSTRCWGLCRNPNRLSLPFSQNRRLTLIPTDSDGESSTFPDKVFFVPVPDQPLSANRYFVVCASGSHAGEICTCSREQDRVTFCCCCLVHDDVKPGPFREGDVYQQVEVVPGRPKGLFSAKAVAEDGIPPLFLRARGWGIRASVPKSLLVDIGPASGVDRALREKKPEVGSSAAVVVGKWYTPFFFVREEESLPKDQMKRSVYYEVTLEQFWEVVFARENPSRDQSRRLEVRATVQTQSALLPGGEPVGRIIPQPDGSVVLRPIESRSGAVTLSRCLMERMEWEQARGRWTPEIGGVAAIETEEEYQGNGDWSSFKCFVLVERFSFRRLNGSLVIALDFRHIHKTIAKWE